MISVSLSLRGNLLNPNTQQVAKLTYDHILLTILTRNLYVILKCTKGCVVFHYLRVCEQEPLKATALKCLQCKAVQPEPTDLRAWKSFQELELNFPVISPSILVPKSMPVEFESRMLGSSHFSEFCLGDMTQGSLQDVAGSPLFPLPPLSTAWEHSLASSLIPSGCPSQVGLGLGDTRKSDVSDAQITSASCQEAPLTASP